MCSVKRGSVFQRFSCQLFCSVVAALRFKEAIPPWIAHLFRPGRAQLRCDLVIFLLRQLSPWRGSSRRFSSGRGYDVKMGVVNGLAAAEPVVLLPSETRRSEPILLRNRRFLHRRQQVTHFIWLKVEKIARADSFRYD